MSEPKTNPMSLSNPLESLNPNPEPAKRTITKAEFIIEQMSKLASAYGKRGELEYDVYLAAFSDVPVANLRKAFAEVPKACKFFPTPFEVLALTGFKSLSPELKAAKERATPPGKMTELWESLVTMCATIEKSHWHHVSGVSGADYLSIIDHESVVGSRLWAQPDPQGYIMVRTHGQTFIGYKAMRLALADKDAFSEGLGMLFLTEANGSKTFVPVTFVWEKSHYAVYHAYRGHYPDYDKPLIRGEKA